VQATNDRTIAMNFALTQGMQLRPWNFRLSATLLRQFAANSVKR
jgi:hypothetical protein